MESWTPDVVLLPDAFGASDSEALFPKIWGADLTLVDSLDELQESLEQEEADLVVVARSLPVSDPMPYKHMAKAMPSGELVQLLGHWCEGEERTGVTIEGFQRVFWHQWPWWWHRWLGAFRGVDAVGKPLQGATVVVAAGLDTSQAIGASLAECGACCVWAGESVSKCSLAGNPTAIVWNGSQLGGREAERLHDWCEFARARQAPLVALLDFPRPETVAAARAIGAAAVLGKPCDETLLCDTIRNAMARMHQREQSLSSRVGSPIAGIWKSPRMAA